jgi:hypothetical protein
VLKTKHKRTFFLCVGSRRLDESGWTKGRAIFFGDARIRNGVDGSWIASTRSNGNDNYIYENNLSKLKSRRGLPDTRPSSPTAPPPPPPPTHCPNNSRHTPIIGLSYLTVLDMHSSLQMVFMHSSLQMVFKRWRTFLEPLSQFMALRAVDRAKIVHLLHDATTKKVITAGSTTVRPYAPPLNISGPLTPTRGCPFFLLLRGYRLTVFLRTYRWLLKLQGMAPPILNPKQSLNL